MVLLEVLVALGLLVLNKIGSFSIFGMTVRVVGSRIKTNRTNMQEPDTLSSYTIALPKIVSNS